MMKTVNLLRKIIQYILPLDHAKPLVIQPAVCSSGYFSFLKKEF